MQFHVVTCYSQQSAGLLFWPLETDVCQSPIQRKVNNNITAYKLSIVIFHPPQSGCQEAPVNWCNHEPDRGMDLFDMENSKAKGGEILNKSLCRPMDQRGTHKREWKGIHSVWPQWFYRMEVRRGWRSEVHTLCRLPIHPGADAPSSASNFSCFFSWKSGVSPCPPRRFWRTWFQSSLSSVFCLEKPRRPFDIFTIFKY